MLQDEIAQTHPGSGSTYANPAAASAGRCMGVVDLRLRQHRLVRVHGAGEPDGLSCGDRPRRSGPADRNQTVARNWDLGIERPERGSSAGVNPLGIQLDHFWNDATGCAIRRVGSVPGGGGRFPRRRSSGLLLPGQPPLFGYGYAGAPQSCWRRDDSQWHRLQSGTAGDVSAGNNGSYAFCVGKPDPGGCAFRIAGRNGYDPGHGSGERRLFPNDWRADLWRVGHGSLASAARCGAGNSSRVSSRQCHPRARGCRRWSYAGERGDDCMDARPTACSSQSCGGASSCSVLSDEAGESSSWVTPTATGPSTITIALAPASYSPPQSQQATVVGTSTTLDLAAVTPTHWIGQGATIAVPLTVEALDLGAPHGECDGQFRNHPGHSFAFGGQCDHQRLGIRHHYCKSHESKCRCAGECVRRSKQFALPDLYFVLHGRLRCGRWRR